MRQVFADGRGAMSKTGFLRHFIACNKHDLKHFVPFFVAEKRYGWIKKETAAFLEGATDTLTPYKAGLALASRFDNFSARSEALLTATRLLSAHIGKPLRDEMYPLVEHWEDEPLAQLDRVAVPWFGVKACGLHVNGFVRKKDGLYLWIGKRASNRQIEPGKLDNMIGGGQPIGISREKNLCKEALEEAGIEPELALTAKYIRPLSYHLELPDGLRSDTLFIYDLELPESFTPRNTDGEVAAFTLKSLDEVAHLVRNTDMFKFNCSMVIADFLIRRGSLGAEDAEYPELSQWLSEKVI